MGALQKKSGTPSTTIFLHSSSSSRKAAGPYLGSPSPNCLAFETAADFRAIILNFLFLTPQFQVC